MNPLSSIFSSASDAAARVSRLTWVMIILSAVIFVGVMAIMLIAITRRRAADPSAVDLHEHGHGWLIWGGTVMPAAVLVALWVMALSAMRTPATAPSRVLIHVTGHQWWWQLDYSFPNGGAAFRTANELHIPVGEPVDLVLTTADVIHSFWVPQLQGKMDLVSGDTTALRLDARHPGRYTGTCAEYCGAQHAHMQITVLAEDSASFARWAAAQATDRTPPSDSLSMLGEREFTSGACASCHTIRGTSARGSTAPDLTHVASRATLAAGAAQNSLASVTGWIANPQAMKPGALMPTLLTLSGPDLRALAAYVSTLK